MLFFVCFCLREHGETTKAELFNRAEDNPHKLQDKTRQPRAAATSRRRLEVSSNHGLGLGGVGRAGWSWGEAPGPYAELARSLRGAYANLAWHFQIPCAFWLLLCCATCELASHYNSHAMLHKHPKMLPEFRTVMPPTVQHVKAPPHMRISQVEGAAAMLPTKLSRLDFAIVLHHVCHIRHSVVETQQLRRRRPRGLRELFATGQLVKPFREPLRGLPRPEQEQHFQIHISSRILFIQLQSI